VGSDHNWEPSPYFARVPPEINKLNGSHRIPLKATFKPQFGFLLNSTMKCPTKFLDLSQCETNLLKYIIYNHQMGRRKGGSEMGIEANQILFVTVVVSLFWVNLAEAQPRCIKCHSRSPEVRTMHEELKGQDCFTCHVRGEKLRQKGGIPEEKHEAFLKQRLTDLRCVKCHGEKNMEKGHGEQSNHATPLSATSYCPKCQLKGDKDWKMCPRCGGPLLDLDMVMRHSALSSDGKLCRKCHFMEASLEDTHIKNVGAEFSSRNDCLECHQGHKECSGCH
jgi:hypothetical protein